MKYEEQNYCDWRSFDPFWQTKWCHLTLGHMFYLYVRLPFPHGSCLGLTPTLDGRLLIPPFTYTISSTGLVHIYIYSVCVHTEMDCQGHHCHFKLPQHLYCMCTMADAAIVLSFIHCLLNSWPFDLSRSDSRNIYWSNQTVSSAAATEADDWSWLSAVVQALISVVQGTGVFRLPCSTLCLQYTVSWPRHRTAWFITKNGGLTGRIIGRLLKNNHSFQPSQLLWPWEESFIFVKMCYLYFCKKTSIDFVCLCARLIESWCCYFKYIVWFRPSVLNLSFSHNLCTDISLNSNPPAVNTQ